MDDDNNNWIKAKGIADESHPRQYLISFYYIITTATTVGYGDISATNDVEMCVAVVFMVVGQVGLTYCISLLGSIVQTWDN
jgi:hypothetical protein